MDVYSVPAVNRPPQFSLLQLAFQWGRQTENKIISSGDKSYEENKMQKEGDDGRLEVVRKGLRK